MLELEGTQLGHYQLQQRLARGGMSEVYLALDTHTRSAVALKIVNKLQEDHTQRFQHEVQVLAQLVHRHILQVFEYGEDETWCYVAMPYVKEGTLRNRLYDGPLSLAEADVLFTQIAAALQWAHEHGIIHRDIKPSNVLLHEGTHVYLADFGLAKSLTDEHDMTQTGCLIGTPEYMAPELSEEPASCASDIYALGVLLYQMLTGQVPFHGETPLAIYWKHLREIPQPPSQLNPALPASVENVILRALEKDPQQRFTSVRAMAEAFSAAVAEADAAQAQIAQLHLTAPSIRYYSAIHTTSSFGQLNLAKLHSLHSRKLRPTYLAFAALLFLFIVPLTLGVTFSLRGLHSATPAALGASVQFVSRHTPPVTVTPTVTNTGNHTTGTSTNTGKATSAVVPVKLPAHNNGGSHNHDGDSGHGSGDGGHKHGHSGGHGHSKHIRSRK
ncbi:MAG TPA: serine/threonine-protein kinase [Ktedonobacteraceae bacterium]|nr:serine/threonine-protein kinase [Ktedonobacteraceae bacterium]